MVKIHATKFSNKLRKINNSLIKIGIIPPPPSKMRIYQECKRMDFTM